MPRGKSPCQLNNRYNPYVTPNRGILSLMGCVCLGCPFCVPGWDKNYGFRLYMSDPSGNYGGWKAAAVGANYQVAQSMLKQDYKDEISREEAVQLALKGLSKTMDSTPY